MKSQNEATMVYEIDDSYTATSAPVSSSASEMQLTELNDEILSLRLNLEQLRETRETLLREIIVLQKMRAEATGEKAFRTQI